MSSSLPASSHPLSTPNLTDLPPAAPTRPAADVPGREDLLQPDPLLDCLVELCRLHGRPASRAALAAGLPLVDGRLTLALAERAAQRLGFATRLLREPLERLDPAALPLILVLHERRACVLLGWDGDTAQVLLPESGAAAVPIARADLQARHAGLVLSARPQFRHDERSPAVRPPRDGHWFWSALREQRTVYRDVLWAALLINLFALALPLFSMNVYDRVVPNHAVETLWTLAVGVVLVLVGDLVLRGLRGHFVDAASARLDVQLSATLMERVLGLRLEQRPASVGSFASHLRGFEQVRDFIASGTVTALVDLPFAALFLVVMAWISPWLVLPVVIAFALMVGGGLLLQQRLHALAETTYRASAQRHAVLVESLTGLETIKAQAAESPIQSRWEEANRYLAGVNVRMRGVSARAVHGTAFLSQLTTVAIVVIGVYLIGERELTMGALIACSMLSGRALAPASQVVGLLMQFQGARTALEGLDRLMAQPVERPPGQTFLSRRTLRGEIEFRQVRFAYPGRQDAALDGVSFRVAPGEHVALIGRVGSGKSTIEKLVLGLYQPVEGAVLLDGIDLRQLDPADVRRNVASVSQDVTLFHGSLRENIVFGLPAADDAAVVAAAERAGLADFVHRHPRGYDLPVGERGDLLSGGQRQAVGLARALLRDAPVLLLDEPTSAMDFSTEAVLTQRLAEHTRDRTLLLVTHRTSLLSIVDRVIVIDGGKVVADGPRDRILEALQSGRVAKAAP